jgi:hypothetical protein
LEDDQERGKLGVIINNPNVSRETFFQPAPICADLRPIQPQFPSVAILFNPQIEMFHVKPYFIFSISDDCVINPFVRPTSSFRS